MMPMVKLLYKNPLLLILPLALLCAVLLVNSHLVPAGDNATYMVLGQSLATGQGYRMISDPRSPPMALYPPGYPVVVAAVLLLTGTTSRLLSAIVPMKLISVALYLTAIAIAYDIFRRRNPTVATMTAVLMAVNPQLLHFASEVGTEIPYLFLSLATIWLFESSRDRPGSRFIVDVSALLAWTFYVRSIALVMAASLALYLATKRELKQAATLLMITAFLALPWFIYTSSLPSTGTAVGLGRGYFALYFSNDPYGTQRASLPDWISRVAQNAQIYASYIWPDALFPHASGIAAALGPAGGAIPYAFSALVLLGLVLELRRRRAGEWYSALFFASCVGYLWAQSRLVVPIIPFALYYLLAAIHALLQPLWRRARQTQLVLLMLACVALSTSAMVADLRTAQRNLRYGLDQPVDTYYARDPEWGNYLRSIRWTAANASQSAVVIARKADLLYILTGLKAMEYPYSVEGEQLMRAVRDNRVDYIVEDAFTWTRTTEQYLAPALKSWLSEEPASLGLVYETDAPQTRVWRVQGQEIGEGIQ
jgi:hypothetical protein